jgi:hypothetical protein
MGIKEDLMYDGLESCLYYQWSWKHIGRTCKDLKDPSAFLGKIRPLYCSPLNPNVRSISKSDNIAAGHLFFHNLNSSGPRTH